MRIFQTFAEAFAEIKRDLAEMGTTVKTQTMQDKVIANDPNFDTLEIQNYSYTVIEARLEDLSPVQPWADAEWEERLEGIRGFPINPGNAWRLRREVWEEFISDNGLFYTYSEQFNRHNQIRNLISRLKEDKYSRQLYATMWEPRFSHYLGRARVPCSLGWHFMYRSGALNMTYFMRSCDYSTHFQNDVFLACKFQEYVATEAGLTRGHFSQFISSLHMYRKDAAGTF